MHLDSKRKSKLMILPIVMIALVSFGWFSLKYFESENIDAFLPAMERYDEAVELHERAVMTPGAKSNIVRHELDSILNKVLTEPMENAVRINYANIALEKIKILDQQIAEMYETSEVVEVRIDALKLAGESVTGIESRMLVEKITPLIKTQKDVVDEIEILTKVIMDRTHTIFDTIIEDGGELTEEHMVSLNEQLGDAETQFDKRAHLFIQMEENKKEIEHLSITLRSLVK